MSQRTGYWVKVMKIQCRISGLDDLHADFVKMGQEARGVFEEMLSIGAEEIKQCWRRSAEKHGHKDTGEMINSISYSARKEALRAYIYPRGYSRSTTVRGRLYQRKKPERNATKAFVLHYGTNKISPSYWVDDAMQEADDNVTPLLLRKWSEFLERRR